MDVRADRVVLALQTAAVGWVTPRDVELAHRISAVAGEFRLTTQTGMAGTAGRSRCSRSASTRSTPPRSGRSGRRCSATSTSRAGPARRTGWSTRWARAGVWFQQMDAPRPQRNRIHFDVSVPHDEAHQRIPAAVTAGGTLVYDAEAQAFWVLADPEGNEACVTTWQGRDG